MDMCGQPSMVQGALPFDSACYKAALYLAHKPLLLSKSRFRRRTLGAGAHLVQVMNPTCFVAAAPAALTKSSFLGTVKRSLTTRIVSQPSRRAHIRAVAEGEAESQLAWVDAIELSEIQPGKAYRRVLAGLDICIACDDNGEVYALANKGPPLGVPLSDGKVVNIDGTGYLRCAQYGSLFELNTGNVKEGSWVTSPPLISNVLRLIFSEPLGVLSYQVRDNGEVLQVLVDVKAREQYEQQYWKGILDASGKADGGYY